MSVAGGIRAGLAFVELKCHDTEFQAAMLRFQEKLTNVGAMCKRLGTQVGIFAGALAIPMVASLRAAQGFDDALRELQASVSDLSPEQLKAVKAESLRLAAAMATAPEKVAQAFTLLAKAGVSVEKALGGAAETAVQFAKVGGIDASQAAELLADAMNVFGTTADKAAQSIASSAASSSVDIHQMSMAMSMAGAVAGMAGQDIDDTSAALAILGSNMLKGSDAGTSLKTMLLHLTAPTGEAKTAMQQLGLSARSFIDTGTGKPMRLPAMIDLLNGKLGKLDAVVKKDFMVRLFGTDAIRAAQILTNAGSKGFDDMLGSMRDAVPLGEQFKQMQGGISGFFSALDAGAKIVAIAFSDSLAPAMNLGSKAVLSFSQGLAWLIGKVPVVGPLIAGLTVAASALSLALFAVAGATALTTFMMNNLPLKVTTALAWAGSVAFGALSKAALAVAASIYAIPGIGWIAGIITAVGALGAAAWWYSGTGDGKKKPNKPPKGAGRGGAQAGLPAPEDLQRGMNGAQAPGAGNGQQRPLMNANDQAALSMKNVEGLLQQLIDVNKAQRPAFT
jgi:TP901 family phage tail tape measure protein